MWTRNGTTGRFRGSMRSDSSESPGQSGPTFSATLLGQAP
jgi:hypothetical protein